MKKKTDTILDCLPDALDDGRRDWIGQLLTPNRINSNCRVDLAQLVRFLVMELIYLSLNHSFDIGVIFMANYSFSGKRRPHRQ
jgi:hypothetical protein